MADSPLVGASFPAVVGVVLLVRRKRLGLSQAEVATAVGVNVSTWSRVENGDAALTIEQLSQAAAVLKIRPSEVLNVAESMADVLASRGVELNSSRRGLENAMSNWRSISLFGAPLAASLDPLIRFALEIEESSGSWLKKSRTRHGSSKGINASRGSKSV